ncbi:MAG: hypothetical protein AAF708_16010 [Deinococcota bacterium]
MIVLLIALSQILSGMPLMQPGTHVRIVLPDLMTVIDVAIVEDDELVFHANLEPNQSVRLLISYSPEDYVVAPVAYVSPEGDDILVHFDGAQHVVSFRTWLDERGISLIVLPEPEGGADDGTNGER